MIERYGGRKRNFFFLEMKKNMKKERIAKEKEEERKMKMPKKKTMQRKKEGEEGEKEKERERVFRWSVCVG